MGIPFYDCSEKLQRRIQQQIEADAARANCDKGLRATEPEPSKRAALVNSQPRKKKGKSRAAGSVEDRRSVTFRAFSRRPLDWDNYWFKGLQDALVKAGILDDDGWRLLEGCVTSEKVYTAEEERTEITLNLSTLTTKST